MFLDFEYSTWAPEAFDVANHWCEYAADYDGSEPERLKLENIPRGEDQKAFIAEYLGLQTDSIEVNIFTQQARNMIKTAHFLWACWGLLCAGDPVNKASHGA